MKAASDVVEVDARSQESIDDAQAGAFQSDGLLILRGLLSAAELLDLQTETMPLVERAVAGVDDDPDFMYKRHDITGDQVPFRVEFVIDKLQSTKVLLGHPFILRTVEKLQGKNFVPTWDSMVFKTAGAGASIPWHRDAAAGGSPFDHLPIFNVDFYLDEADETNCLWGLPGSNQWPTEQANAEIANRSRDGFEASGAVPIPMQPGDALLHNIMAVHGSPPAQSKLRRTLYYEFRPGEVESLVGPHTPDYIPLKQKVLLACLDERAKSPHSKDERPFTYSASGEFVPPAFKPGEKLKTYRYPHKDFWRN